jgi:signal transduction histidine kinase
LGTALRAYIGEWSERTGLPVAYSAHLDGALPLPATTELAVYRLVQEALANIAKHASATDVRVSLEVRDSALEVEVRDNGRGMSVDRDRGASEPLGGLSAGLGLFGAQERIGLVGGQLTLESAPGQGTTVRAVIPLASRPAEA